MMETVDSNICRTCLGPLEEAPKNLLDAEFADALDLLRGFVANLVDLQTEDVINICSLCYEKLDYICKFREQCQKSFKDYMEIKNKKDPVISNLGQIFEDDYIAAKIKIDLDNENLEETITIYKNSDETNGSESAIEPTIESATTVEPQSTSNNNTKRGTRAKQFPSEDVLSEIDESNLSQTAFEKRKCILCAYVAKTNRQLCIHMKHKHLEELRTWCSRCNIQTSDLEEHTKTVQCSEYVCKFCNKKCRRLFMLLAHLKSHASEHFSELARKAKQEADKTLEDAQPPQALQQLSNVVFQYSAIAAANVESPTIQAATIVVEPTNNNTTSKVLSSNNAHTLQTITSDGKIKVSRVSKQYDSALVLQALAESANYMKDMKNRQCTQCSTATSLASGLNLHMARSHPEVFALWCRRCNMLTDNLQAHKELVNCEMFQCKFCEKAFNKVNKLTKHMQCHCHEIFRNKATANNLEDEPTIHLQSHTSSVSNDHQQSGDSMPILENTDGNMAYESSQQEFQFYSAVNTDVNMSYQDSSQEQLGEDDEAATAALKLSEDTDGTGMTFESAGSTFESSVENTDGNITYESLGGAMNVKMAYESFAADAVKFDVKQEEEEEGTSEESHVMKEMTESSSMDESFKMKDEIKTEDSFLSYATNSNDSYAATPYEDSGDADSDLDADDAPDSAEDAPGWALLDQIAPADIVRALTAIRKPVHVHNTCAICKSVMTDNRGLSLHMTIVHKEEKAQWCRTCNELFDDIDKHREIHAPKCEFCNKTFIFLSHLRTHLKNHARNHDFNTSTWLTCKVCSSSFPDEDSLNTHDCSPDPSKVDHKSAYEMNVHMRKHIIELPYKCSHCDKCFAENHLLTNHEKTHAEEKRICCQTCKKVFVNNKQLESHMTTAHSEKSLQCPHCDKYCLSKTQLTNHRRTHLEKLHMCTFENCGRTFITKMAMGSHFRQKHAVGQPVKCSYCDMTFKSKNTLKTHEYVHTGVKPFKCTECSYSARQNHRLTAHIKQQHQKTQVPAQDDTPVLAPTPVAAKAATHTCVFCQERFPTHLQLITHTYAQHGEMPMEGVVNNIENNLSASINATATSAQIAPNVVNITSHHIIIQDGNSSQTIQISGLDMSQPMEESRINESNLTQLVAMESSSSTSLPQLSLEGNVDTPMEGSVTMDDLDQVPIQIVYKPQGLG